MSIDVAASTGALGKRNNFYALHEDIRPLRGTSVYCHSVAQRSKGSLIGERWLIWGITVLLFTVGLLAFGAWQGALLARIARMQTGAWIITASAALAVLAWQARGGIQACWWTRQPAEILPGSPST
jgi:hypothetical protein